VTYRRFSVPGVLILKFLSIPFRLTTSRNRLSPEDVFRLLVSSNPLFPYKQCDGRTRRQCMPLINWRPLICVRRGWHASLVFPQKTRKIAGRMVDTSGSGCDILYCKIYRSTTLTYGSVHTMIACLMCIYCKWFCVYTDWRIVRL
jgi:hypothetical protein